MKRILILGCVGVFALTLSASGEQITTNVPVRAKAKTNVSTAQSAHVNRAPAVRSSGQMRTQASVSSPGYRQHRNVTVQNNSNVAVSRNHLRSARVHAAHDATVQNTNQVRARSNVAVNRERNINRSRNFNVNRERNVTINREKNVNINRERNMTFNRDRNARVGFANAARLHGREFHDRDWWRHHYNRIVFVNNGWYYWDGGWWYPAWGYAPTAYYPYDGPIYGYNGLPPDRIVMDVQVQLRRDGYYNGPIDGVLGPMTRQAITAFQADHGLAVTSTIDQPTLATLGLT